MAEFEILSKQKHKDMYFKPPSDFTFVSEEPLLQISWSEVPLLSKDYPLVFVKNNAGTYNLSALFTLIPKQNVFLKPDGTWKSTYIPAAFRCHPFRLLSIEDKESGSITKKALGFMKGSPLLSFDSSSDRQKVFDNEGNLTDYLKKIGDILSALDRDLRSTNKMVKKISDLDIFVPLVISDDLGNKKTVQDIVMISEEKLLALSSKVIKELLKDSILEMIFRHRFSINNFQNLLNKSSEIDISTKEKVLRKNKEEKAAEVNNLVQNLLVGD